MVFSTHGFVIGALIGQGNGITDPSALTRLGILGGLFGCSAKGLVLTSVLARQSALPRPSARIARRKEPSHQQIQVRAYFIGERRRNSGLAGDATSDWVQAERELKEEFRQKIR